MAIVGYPDELMGERSCACVVPRPGESLALDSLVAYLKERQVAAYKFPERLLLLEAMPRNPMGKVIKQELRERAGAPA